MITKPALHRVQDLSKTMANLYAKEELQGDVDSYLELRQLQNDAVEDDDMCLAKSIGRSMRHIREKHDKDMWDKEFNKQDV